MDTQKPTAPEFVESTAPPPNAPPATTEGPTYYVNQARANSTLFEVQLAFYLDRFTGQGDQKQARHVCNLVMSPQHGKALLEILKVVVEGYEQKIGPIQMALKDKTA